MSSADPPEVFLLLPLVVHSTVPDTHAIPLDRCIGSELAAKVAQHGFMLLIELALLPRAEAYAMFGDDLADKLEAALGAHDCGFGTLPHGDAFLRRLSSLELYGYLKAQLNVSFPSITDPTAICIALGDGRFDIDQEQIVAVNKALAPTGLRLRMRLSGIFDTALSREEIAFYRMPATRLRLPQHVHDILDELHCPDVYGVTVITHMSGFPHRAEVEAAFNAHGRTLDRTLRYEHYRQIFFGWTP